MPYSVEPCRYYSYPSSTKLWRFLPCNHCCYFGGGGYSIYCCCTPADEQYILDLGSGWTYRGGSLCVPSVPSICNAFAGKVVVDYSSVLEYPSMYLSNCYYYRYAESLCFNPYLPATFYFHAGLFITMGGQRPPNPPDYTPYYSYIANVSFGTLNSTFDILPMARVTYQSELFPLPPLSNDYASCNWWKIPLTRLPLTRGEIIDGYWDAYGPEFSSPCNPNTAPETIYLESA